jgi:hypothetical protein
VTFPPHAFGVALKEEVAEPLMRHSPVNPLLYDNELAAGIEPQATVMLLGGVLNVGTAGRYTLTVNIVTSLTQLFAFFTVMFPVYVPTGVLAGTAIVIGLDGKAASVTLTKLFVGVEFQTML